MNLFETIDGIELLECYGLTRQEKKNGRFLLKKECNQLTYMKLLSAIYRKRIYIKYNCKRKYLTTVRKNRGSK